MILMYCISGAIISIFLVPVMYIKTIANQIFICINNKREAYKGQNFLNLLAVVFVNPVIIVLSILIDLFSMPSLLLKDEKYFEHKY